MEEEEEEKAEEEDHRLSYRCPPIQPCCHFLKFCLVYLDFHLKGKALQLLLGNPFFPTFSPIWVGTSFQEPLFRYLCFGTSIQVHLFRYHN